jgi:DNA-binding LacI/PurR family transcriptional regulator
MATIGDVARHAGVSRSTVSYALSGNRPISSETRERVAKAIHELGFTANAGARALATSKSWIMGLIVPFTPEEFAPATLQYVLSASETARALGYDVLMVSQQEGDAGIARITESGLVDGVIVLDIRRRDDRIAALRRAAQPSVLLGLPDDRVSIDSVDLDFRAAGRKLVRHLHERGHRSIIFLTLPQQVFDLDLGYAWRFREAALGLAGELGMVVRVIPGDADPEVRARSIGEALDQSSEATAMLVHNDGALADLPMLFLERGLSIPRDLSVVSLFPERFGRLFSLPYTAIETSATAVAARAVNLLAARIENPELPPVRELFAPEIIDRGSSRMV